MAITTLWWFKVITHAAICWISTFTLRNIQCTYSEYSTPIGLLLLGLPAFSQTITYFIIITIILQLQCYTVLCKKTLQNFANMSRAFANSSRTFANSLQMLVYTLLRDKFSTPCMNKTLHNTAWQTYLLRDCCEVLVRSSRTDGLCLYVRTYLTNFNKPAKRQLEVITHKTICPISIFTLLNIQCTYSENSTPIGLLLLG